MKTLTSLLLTALALAAQTIQPTPTQPLAYLMTVGNWPLCSASTAQPDCGTSEVMRWDLLIQATPNTPATVAYHYHVAVTFTDGHVGDYEGTVTRNDNSSGSTIVPIAVIGSLRLVQVVAVQELVVKVVGQ